MFRLDSTLTPYTRVCQDAMAMVRDMSNTWLRPIARAALAALTVAGTGLLVAAGCGPGEPAGEPIFPERPETQWAEMRDCRHSHEHELRFIRVFASPDAEASYLALSPETPYPVGARLVKLEYDDAECTQLIGYTALEKLPAGTSPAGGDWLWQRVSPEREVMEEGAMPRCINCHEEHCEPPYGYDLTCAEEI
jgi:hypothetical protein